MTQRMRARLIAAAEAAAVAVCVTTVSALPASADAVQSFPERSRPGPLSRWDGSGAGSRRPRSSKVSSQRPAENRLCVR